MHSYQMLFHRALCLLLLTVLCGADDYLVDNSAGNGRRFDGVGAVSGGGVTIFCCHKTRNK